MKVLFAQRTRLHEKRHAGENRLPVFENGKLANRIVINANRNKMKLSEFPCLGDVFRNVAIDVYTVFLFLPIAIIYRAECFGN